MEITNSLEEDFKKYLCNILILENNYNCYKRIFTNENIFDNVKSIKKNIDLFITERETMIENLFLLIAIIPFIEINSKLRYKINEIKILSLFYSNNSNKSHDNIIIIQKADFESKNKELINLLNYDWEIIPSRNIINILRYVINHYYEETCLNDFEDALNINFKRYIKINQNYLSLENKTDLISKK